MKHRIPAVYESVIDLETPKALGLAIPPSLLLRADACSSREEAGNDLRFPS
jgi:hypothetical protein